MLTYAPLKPEHLRYVIPAASQTVDLAYLLREGAAEVLSQSFGISAWYSSRCIAAAGIIPLWSGRAECWSILTPAASPHMRALTRKVRAALDVYPARRLEMQVAVDNVPGHRWAPLLGFELEARLNAWHPDGSDVMQYVRLRSWTP